MLFLTAGLVSGNRLAALPESVRSVAGLTTLSAPGNRLAGLPATLAWLTALTDLDLDANRYLKYFLFWCALRNRNLQLSYLCTPAVTCTLREIKIGTYKPHFGMPKISPLSMPPHPPSPSPHPICSVL
jgi:hypothetical protein